VKKTVSVELAENKEQQWAYRQKMQPHTEGEIIAHTQSFP